MYLCGLKETFMIRATNETLGIYVYKRLEVRTEKL